VEPGKYSVGFFVSDHAGNVTEEAYEVEVG
jgi:hypothetical protein